MAKPLFELKHGALPDKVKNWYKEIYPNQKFDFTKHKYGVPKEHKLNRNLKSIYQYYKTVPGYYPQLISNKKTLDSIKTWFDKAIKKGPVSYTDLQNKFPAQASPTLEKALGKDFEKLTRHTPVTTKIKPKILKIVDEVYANKRPLMEAAPSRLYKATYGKPYIMGTSNMGTISGILAESDKYDKMRSKIKAAVGRVGGGNKLFETVTLKNFDKADIRTELPRTSGNLVEENILRDLDRYISRGGKDFKYTPDGRTNKFKTLKIKDLKKGDVLTYDRIKELIKKGDPRFKEYKKVFDNMKRLKLSPYIDPITKEPTTLLQGLQKATGIEAPLHIQHNKGILESPLKNLSISTHKANIGAKMVGSLEDIETLGVRSTLPGGKRVYGPKLSFEDEVNRLTKFADRMIKGGGTRTLKTPTQTLTLKIIKENAVSQAANNTNKICEAVFGIGKATGGVAGGGCARQMELEFDKAPEQTLNKISQSNSPKLKSFAQRALSLLPKLGTPGKIAAGAVAGAAAIGALTYNKELGEFVNPLNDDKASQATVTEWIKDNPVKTVAGTSIGFSTQEIPGAYKKARELGRGRVRSSLGITGALKPVLTTFGTPAMTALFEAPFAAKRLEEGETMTEVLTDPLGPTLGLSLMETLSQKAGVVRDAPKRTMLEGAKNYFNLSNVGTARPGVTSKILRMGMSPRMIAGASRFLGLPGLALSLGLTGYGAYKNYQNEEGMLYNLFNKDE